MRWLFLTGIVCLVLGFGLPATDAGAQEGCTSHVLLRGEKCSRGYAWKHRLKNNCRNTVTFRINRNGSDFAYTVAANDIDTVNATICGPRPVVAVCVQYRSWRAQGSLRKLLLIKAP